MIASTRLERFLRILIEGGWPAWVTLGILVALLIACRIGWRSLLKRKRPAQPVGKPWRLLWFWLIPGIGFALLVPLLFIFAGDSPDLLLFGAAAAFCIPVWLLVGCRIIYESGWSNDDSSDLRD